MLRPLQKSTTTALTGICLFLMLQLLSATTAFSQTTLIAFDPSSAGSTFPPSPWTVFTIDPNFTCTTTGLVRGSNLAASGTNAAGCYGTSGGEVVGGDETRSFTFGIKTTCAATSLATISGHTRRSATGPTSANVYYSLDGGTTYSLVATAGSWNTSTTSGTTGTADSYPLSSITALQNIPAGTTIKFKITPNGTTGTWYFTGAATALVLSGTYTTTPAPVIGSSPSNSSIAITAGTTFTASSVTGATSYQWQRNTSGVAGGTWVNITSGTMDPTGTYSGFSTTSSASSNTLTLANVPISWNGYGYRCQAINCAATVNSTPALLTVTSGSACSSVTSGTVTPSATTFCGSGSQLLSLSGATVGSDITYQWASSSSLGGPYTNITGATSGTYNASSVSVTTYYQCTTTCTVTTNTATSGAGVVSVNPTPSVSPITGATSLITGGTTSLTDPTTGTTTGWTSVTPGVATVGSTGNVTAVATGTSTISYTVTNGFGCSASATTIVTVSFYCGTTVSGSGDAIGIVTSGGVTNITSYSATSSPEYNNQTAVNGVSATPGTTINYTVTNSTGFAGTSSLWIDWNGSVVLADSASETPMSAVSIGSSGGTHSGSFTVPLTARGGLSVMRLGFGESPATYGTTPCGSGSFGNVVDFYFKVLPAVTGNPSDLTIVSGDPATFSTTTLAAATYQWQRGISGSYANIDNTTDGGVYANYNTNTLSIPFTNTGLNGYTYRVVASNSVGSATSTSATLNVNAGTPCSGAPPAGTIAASPSAFCVSGSSLLSFTNGTSISGLQYQWSSSSTNTPPGTNISGATNTTYTTPTVSSTTYYWCTSTCVASSLTNISTVGVVSINPLPSIGVTPPGGNFCTTTSGVSMTASGANTYSWAPATGLSVTTGSSVSASPSNNTVYTVTGTSLAGCVGTAMVTVNYFATPATPILAPSSLNVCTGGATNLLTAGIGAAGPVSLTTSATTGNANVANGTLSSTLAVSTIPVGAVVNSAAVTLNCTANSTFLTDYVFNLVSPNGEVLNLVNSTHSTGSFSGLIVSSAGSAAINAPYSGTYAADNALNVGPAAFLSNTASWSSLYSSPLGTWTLLVYNTTGFASNAFALSNWSLNINYSLPSVTWSPVTYLYTNSGGTTAYAGTTTTSVYENPTAAATTIYTVTATNAAGCASSATTAVTVNALPTVGTAGGGVAFCFGGNATLSGTGAMSYSWNSGVTDGVSFTPAAGNHTYTVTGTDANSCSNTATTTVTAYALPSVGAAGGGSVCGGSMATLSGTGAVSYGWTGGITDGVAFMPAPGISSYTVTGTDANSCFNTATTSITVNALPTVGATGGGVAMCANGTVILNGTGAVSYSWTGGVTDGASFTPGVGFNSYTVTGTDANSCSNTATTTVTVNALPTVGSTGGGIVICSDGTVTLSGTGAVSYSWTGGVTDGASFTPATGSDSYTVTGTDANSCSNTATTTVTVNPVPTVSPITGLASVCAAGGSTTLSDVTPGGDWTSLNLNASVDASGNITGNSAGTSTIQYSVSNGFGCNTVVTDIVTVNSLPAVASITGTTTVPSVCSFGGITVLTDATDGGAWSSSNTNASVDASGNVTGNIAGTCTISYTVTNGFGCTNSATKTVVINPLPAAISGATFVCPGVQIRLSDVSAGGSWSSSDAGTASVGSTSGVVTGVIPGTAIVTYSLPTTCIATAEITVNPVPIISGPALLCTGNTISLSSSVAGGTWTSSNPAHATVDPVTGTVTGINNGTVVIGYLPPSGCSASVTLTINGTPSGIAGVAKTCLGTFTTLNDVAGGGMWSSSNPAVGSINTTTGLTVTVTGLTLGTTTISYMTGSGCAATTTVTVNPIYAIAGATSLCVGSAMSLSDDATGGSWSSTRTATATVGGSTGVVTGAGAGTATIVYTTTAGCASSVIVTVQTTPTTIIGNGIVCVGSSSALSDVTGGGAWSADNSNVSVDISGVITGSTAGTSTISYRLTDGCVATRTVTVNDAPAAIANTVLCAGSTVALSDASAGGTWTSSTPSVATVGLTSGVLAAVAGGTATITYTTGVGGCSITTLVTVNPILPISGNMSVCIGGSSDLGDPTPAGTWSSTDATITINGSTGLVTGVSAGTAVVTYTIPAGCSRTAAITINPAPTPVTGVMTLCAGATTALTDDGAGTWTSGTGSVATVNGSTGIVTGVSSGVANITYQAGAGCIAVAAVTVTPAPAPIAGVSSVCVGSTISLSDVTTGGTWSTTSANISLSGAVSVTGLAGGSATVTYTLSSSGCSITRNLNANSLPTAILGNTIVCAGAATYLSDATTGGISWGSSNTSVATISGSGAVIGLAVGTTTITYTVGTGCITLTTVSVTSLPSPVSGNAAICPGATVALADASGAGMWTSGNVAIASVDPGTGIVTGAGSGTAIITFAAGGAGCIATTVVTVSSLTAIYGTMSMCQAATTTLHNTTTGGIWSTTSGNASVGSTTGIVTSISSGTATVTYTLPSGCLTTAVLTINSLPAGITGNAPICAGSTFSLGETATGGTWGGSNLHANVDASGDVTGLAAGTAIISYTLPTGCLTMLNVTVNAIPGVINGSTTVCVGSTVSLSDVTAGGAWSSSSSAASVGSTGLVSGLLSGTSIISYTLATGCGAATTLTVADVPSSMSGNSFVCVGSSTNLTDVSAGGSWTTSNSAIATVGSSTGTVTGVAAGTATISYKLASGCSSQVIVTVTAIPAAIAGSATVCSGATASLSDATTGGTWSSNAATVASVGSTGVVSGIGTSGTATISYTVGLAGCSNTKVITVNPSPSAITGVPSACISSTTALTDVTTGGTWTSSSSTIATVVASTGVVTGVAAGTASISYASAGCAATVVVTVNPVPSSIIGATSVCVNASILLSDLSAGGTWSSTADGSIVSTGSASALLTGLLAGTASITYTLPTGCFKTIAETVKPLPTPILGNLTVCGIGNVTFLSDATAGTSWAISPVGTATISASGRVYGVGYGTATVTYNGSNGCVLNSIVTVNTLPSVSPITGPSSVAHLSSITLSDITLGGAWSSTTPTIASIGSASGIVTGVATAGTTTISYLITDGFGCKNAATKIVTVTATSPHPGETTVGATTTIVVGGSVDLFDEFGSGAWSSNNISVATVDENGSVAAISAGIAEITHLVALSNGETATTVTPVIVSQRYADLRIVPNPNNGTLTVKGVLGAASDEDVMLEITNVLGQVVYKKQMTASEGRVNELISLSSALANGMYMLTVHTGVESKVLHFVIEK